MEIVEMMSAVLISVRVLSIVPFILCLAISGPGSANQSYGQ